MNNKFIDKLNEILILYELKVNDICIVGSSIFTILYSIENNDIDISINPKKLTKILKKNRITIRNSKFYEINDKVDLYKNRYYCLGISDKQIFKKRLFISINNYNYILPEIEYAYKQIKQRPKDCITMNEIDENNKNTLPINYSLIYKLTKNKKILFKKKVRLIINKIKKFIRKFNDI